MLLLSSDMREGNILKKCFVYTGRTRDVYYIPFVSFYVYKPDISMGAVSEWGCYIAVKKITIKDGKIVENRFLDSGKMNIEVAIETGEGVFFTKSTCQMLSKEGLWEFHRNTYKIQHEISCPFTKCRREEGCQHVIFASVKAGYEAPTPGVYQGKLDIKCSIGENQIETEWPFEYVVKPQKAVPE